MKRILGILFILSLPLVVRAKDADDQYNSIEYLRSDFQQAFAVELIHPLDIAPDDTVKVFGHAYRTSARVVESFKGEAKAGDVVDLYTVFEDKPNDFYAKQDRIVFLLKQQADGSDRWIFMEMENSSREASKTNLENMREISSASKESSAASTWLIHLTSSGGFAGHGHGGIDVGSTGDASFTQRRIVKSGKMTDISDCPFKLTGKEQKTLSDLVRSADPSSWKQEYGNVSPDEFITSIQVVIRKEDSPEIVYSTTFPESAQIPKDLSDLMQALTTLASQQERCHE